MTASIVDVYTDLEGQDCGTAITIAVDRQHGSVLNTKSVTLQGVPAPEMTEVCEDLLFVTVKK